MNIFLANSFKQIKLGDLGVACSLDSQSNHASPVKSPIDNDIGNMVNSNKVGTPFYLAPEIWNDKPYSMKSDMWALGVSLYELCTKQKPFIAENMDSLHAVIMNGAPRDMDRVLKISRDLHDIVLQLLRKNLDSRPSIIELL